MIRLGNRVNGTVAVLFCTMLAFLAGCAALQEAALERNLATAYTVHTAVLIAGHEALANDWIDVHQAQALLDIADNARAFLDAARAALAAGLPRDAESAITLALNILMQVQAFLRESAQ